MGLLISTWVPHLDLQKVKEGISGFCFHIVSSWNFRTEKWRTETKSSYFSSFFFPRKMHFTDTLAMSIFSMNAFFPRLYLGIGREPALPFQHRTRVTDAAQKKTQKDCSFKNKLDLFLPSVKLSSCFIPALTSAVWPKIRDLKIAWSLHTKHFSMTVYTLKKDILLHNSCNLPIVKVS